MPKRVVPKKCGTIGMKDVLETGSVEVGGEQCNKHNEIINRSKNAAAARRRRS